MQEPVAAENTPDVAKAAENVLHIIDREREREIISRRFGLHDRKETLEQIGELLGITRERVRQLEKAVLIRLRIAGEEGQSDILAIEKVLVRHLSEMGNTARLSDLATAVKPGADGIYKSQVGFIAELSPRLTTLSENDRYHQGVTLKSSFKDEKAVKKAVDSLVKIIKEHGEAIDLEALFEKTTGYDKPSEVHAVASLSKNLAELRGFWGLTKWPTVNPKNIRDKIYVILQDSTKPMHFSDIARAIKDSDFKRKNVTTQAIHNELIKDKRFVLIGRGIYALKEWGYSKGTVSDVIADILKKEAAPLHRDEIVKRVLKSRQVRETTILLNLQSKPEFKRVAKATYIYAEQDA
ncbi:MAG: sigma factor-like helix-turn-helix DNA-binding protein [Acidobacteriota bacterium]